VKLFSAVRRHEVRFHQLAPDGPAAAKGHALPAAVMKDRERAQIVDSLSRDWDPRRYHDDYEEQLRDVIKAKSKGKTIEPAEQKKPAEVVDLMEALRASLEKPRGGAAKRSGSGSGTRGRSARRATKRSAPRGRTKRTA
jgi:DNA end-binding protein Ku